MKITLSVIKADVGGYVGHSESHPDVLAKAEEPVQIHIFILQLPCHSCFPRRWA